MSEKLYKVVEAVDLFDDGNPIPKRYLVFMDSNGNQIKKFFPENRTTLFFQGDLYDWYGNKVRIDEKIKRIRSPLGYTTDQDGIHETFIIELKKGGLTWARLERDPLFTNDLDKSLVSTRPSVAKYLMTSYRSFIFEEMILAANSKYRVLEKLDPQGIIYAFLRCHHPNGINNVTCTYIENTRGRQIGNRIYSDWIHAQNISHPLIENAFLLGDIIFSKNGNRMTTYCFDSKMIGQPNFEIYRVSTDASLSKLLNDYGESANNIHWFLDPEPES